MSLQQAFHLSRSNMANLLVNLHQGGVALPNGSVYTAANCVADWSKGGKQFCEQYWRNSANADRSRLVGLNRARNADRARW